MKKENTPNYSFFFDHCLIEQCVLLLLMKSDQQHLERNKASKELGNGI